MKKLMVIVLFFLLFLPIVHAEIKDYVYDGKEIYVHVKKDHVSTIVFPESINAVIRGFGADTYVVQRNDKELNILELMPTASEVAEMTVIGVSGEDYVVRCVASENFYTKLTIHRTSVLIDKNGGKTIVAKMDTVPEASIEKQEL